MSLPVVTFIDGDPPPPKRKARGETANNSAFVLGQLMTQPGRWAAVGGGGDWSPTIRSNRLRESAKRWGVEVESVTRSGEWYARYLGAST